MRGARVAALLLVLGTTSAAWAGAAGPRRVLGERLRGWELVEDLHRHYLAERTWAQHGDPAIPRLLRRGRIVPSPPGIPRLWGTYELALVGVGEKGVDHDSSLILMDPGRRRWWRLLAGAVPSWKEARWFVGVARDGRYLVAGYGPRAGFEVALAVFERRGPEVAFLGSVVAGPDFLEALRDGLLEALEKGRVLPRSRALDALGCEDEDSLGELTAGGSALRMQSSSCGELRVTLDPFDLGAVLMTSDGPTFRLRLDLELSGCLPGKGPDECRKEPTVARAAAWARQHRGELRLLGVTAPRARGRSVRGEDVDRTKPVWSVRRQEAAR